MSNQQEQIRNLLISYNVFQEYSEYLSEYVNLICNNISTPQVKFETHKHHIIPVAYYSSKIKKGKKHSRLKLEKKAKEDTNNFCINLTKEDHIRAHCYMALASKACWFTLINVAAIELLSGSRVYNPEDVLESLAKSEPPKNKRCWIHRGEESKNVSVRQLQKYLDAGWELKSKNRHHQNTSISTTKNIWMHYGAEKKLVSKDLVLQHLKAGWEFGMGTSDTPRKKHWVNNGIENTSISAVDLLDYLEEGYSYGKLKAGK